VRNVLLIFPSVFSKAKKEKLVENIRRKLLTRMIKISSMKSEENYIVLDVCDIVEAKCALVGMFGIDKIGIAKKTQNDFSNVVRAIVATGKKIIMPREKFLVKVKLYKNNDSKTVNYEAKDVEFASSGQLVSELSGRSARPATTKDTVVRIIESYIDNKYAYVCVKTTKSLGGLPFNSQNYKLMCSIHGPLSFLSCFVSMRCGFLPKIFLLYTDEVDLRKKVKLSKPIIDMIDQRRYEVSTARINLSPALDVNTEQMLLESIYCRILTLLPGEVVIVPLTAAIFPTWYVNSIVKDIVSVGKIPWTPLIFASNIIYDVSMTGGVATRRGSKEVESLANPVNSRFHQPCLALDAMFDRKSYEKQKQMINDISHRALETLKTISFKIRSNYVHDIIDSI
jgi:hypothetical protein